MPIDLTETLDRTLALHQEGGALHPGFELQPGEIVGAFRVLSELSRGGMATVYLAERADGQFAQKVALKLQRTGADVAAARALFMQEREIVARLEHPGIARLIDGGSTDNGTLWFAMEWVDGAPIDRWCAAQPDARGEAIRLLIELCDALSFAHARLLVHRDIKPSNVMVAKDGRIKLLDFGIAQLAGGAVHNTALTPGYASPEQFYGEPMDITSDIYQIGLVAAVLFNVFDTERHTPPVSESDSRTEPVQPPRAHITHALRRVPQPKPSGQAGPIVLPVQYLAHLPRALSAILLKATALKREHRYETASALKADLQRYLQHFPVQALGRAPGYRFQCLVKRHPFSSAAGALALTALVTLGAQVRVERDQARMQAALAQASAVQATQSAQRSQASVKFLTDLLKWADPNQQLGAEVSVEQALAQGVRQLELLQGQPLAQAELTFVVGEIYLQRRELETAKPLLKRALSLLDAADAAKAKEAESLSPGAQPGAGQKSRHESDPYLRARIAGRYAVALTSAEERTQSIALLEQATAYFLAHQHLEEYCASEYTLTLRTLQRGDAQAASTRAEARYRFCSAELGSEHRSVLNFEAIQLHLASINGSIEQEVPLREALLKRVEKSQGAEHSLTGLARLNLIRAYAAVQRFDQAQAMLQQEQALRARVWGVNHAEYARFLRERSFVSLQRKDFAAAISDAQAGLLIAQHSEEGGKYVVQLLMAEGDAHLGAANYPAAERAYRQALLPKWRASHVVPDPGEAEISLAQVKILQGRAKEAAVFLQQAQVQLRDLQPNNLRHVRYFEVMAQMLEASGEKTQAAAALEEAQSRLRAMPSTATRTAQLDSLSQWQLRLAAKASHGGVAR